MEANKAKEIFYKIAFFISIGLYIISLTQKSFCTEKSCGDSIAVVLSGFIGFLTGGAALTWLANPILWLAWVKIKNIKFSFYASVISFLLSISFLLFNNVISDEAGHYSKIISYQAGYWLWVSSALTMTLGNCYKYLNIQNEKNASR